MTLSNLKQESQAQIKFESESGQIQELLKLETIIQHWILGK